MKTHLANGGCGRDPHTTTDVNRVTCLLCAKTEVFVAEKAKSDAAKEEAFKAQIPHRVSPAFTRLNDDGVMECSWCGGVLFRERPRSLFSFHFVCANEECGKSMHPMTETGMCT